MVVVVEVVVEEVEGVEGSYFQMPGLCLNLVK